MKDVSVVILTYNRQDKVKALVDTLRKHPGGNDLEIVVTSDGCDPKPDVDAKLIWQEDHGIRAATARNNGINATTRPNIVLFDDDVTPHPMCINAHRLALTMYDVSYGLLPEAGWFVEADSRARFFFNEQQLMWKFAFSGNMAMRRSAWESIGEFDENFNGGHGFEDIDWGYRAKLMQLRVHYNRLAMALHPQQHLASEDIEPVAVNRRKFYDKWSMSITSDGFEVV
jgi:GT2 family glycosyltransferase